MYRRNTASQFIYFALVNASTGAALTGASVTAFRALDGGAQASATGTTTELANGQYRFNLSQADTNGDYGSYLFTATNAVPVEKTVVFTAANPTDAAGFGLSRLDQTVGSRMATYTQPTGFLAADFTRLDAAVSSRMATYTQPTGFLAANFGNLDAAVSSRMATYTQPTGFLAATFPATVASPTNITSASGVTLAAVTHTGAVIPTVTSVTNAVTAGTVTDKTGYSLASGGLAAVTTWTVAINGNITGNLSGSVGSVTGAVGSVTGNVGGNVVGSVGSISGVSFPANFASMAITVGGAVTVGTNNDKTGYTTNAFSGGALTTITQIDDILSITDILGSMIESDGAGQFRFDTIAMSMAPSGGGGGGNPWLTDIGTGYTGTQAGKVLMDAKAKTDLITAGNVTYTSMVDPDGEIPGPIFIGDDYKTVHANAFSWTIPAIPGMTAATAVVRFGGVNALLGRAWLVTGTATDLGGGLWRLVCEMDKSVSANLLPGLYDWTVEVSLTGGNEITRIYSDRKVEVRSKPT